MPPTKPEIVAVTGCSGRLGKAAVRALKGAGYRVRGLDRVANPDADECLVSGLEDVHALETLMRGVRGLIHLAATPDDSPEPGWFEDQLVPNNIVALHPVLETAGKCAVPRLVLASSGQVNWHQQFEGPLPITPLHALTPRGWYAATKVFLEAAGWSHARNHAAAVIAIRLGWCPRKGQAPEIASSEPAQDVYLSPGDAGRLFVRSVAADVPQGFHVIHATSLPVRQAIFDNGPAEHLIGWVPTERWPQDAETGL